MRSMAATGMWLTSTVVLSVRVPPDSTTVDVNHIPVAAIERIEVLKDGASAIYGSDAIGGVINFILRKDYKGGEVTPYANITQHPHGSGWGATDRIAAVDRGRAILQDLDALD